MMRPKSPNDPKLSDTRRGRDSCAVGGEGGEPGSSWRDRGACSLERMVGPGVICGMVSLRLNGCGYDLLQLALRVYFEGRSAGW
jgi:hypothetical protein